MTVGWKARRKEIVNNEQGMMKDEERKCSVFLGKKKKVKRKSTLIRSAFSLYILFFLFHLLAPPRET